MFVKVEKAYDEVNVTTYGLHSLMTISGDDFGKYKGADSAGLRSNCLGITSVSSDQAPFWREPWHKLGLRVTAPGTPLMRSHAMLPTAYRRDSTIRVLFSSCDDDLRGRIFLATIESTRPYTLISVKETPVLDIGPAGAFDADGVNPSSILQHDDELLLSYIGWRRGPPDSPYTLIAGLARSYDGGQSFEKLGQMLPLSQAESLFRTAPYIFKNGDAWGTIYIGGSLFIDGPSGKRQPVYSLRYAESEDCYSWPDQGKELLAPDVARGELGFGRPVLFGDGANTRLMISVRTFDGYRLCSGPWNGGRPVRDDLVPLLATGPEDWDRTSTCFGAFCRTDSDDLLFYNGNEFGRTGFGLASRPLQARQR